MSRHSSVVFIFFGLLWGTYSLAVQRYSLPVCQRYPVFQGGLHIKNFNRCQQLLTILSQKKQCNFLGPMPDAACTKRVLSHSFCQQTRALLHAIPSATLGMISAQSYGNLTLVRSTTVADGVDTYYIVNPAGCLMNTSIDPRTLSTKLREQYANQSFIILAQAPHYLHYPHREAIVITLQVRTPCLACKTIGCAQVKFNFSSTGQWIGTNLVNFSQCEKAPPNPPLKKEG